MKAIVYRTYGSPDVLELTEIAKPVPGDDEVLLRIRAAAVNPMDWHLMRGLPPLLRAIFRFKKPSGEQPGRPGRDVAGVIEAVGRSVTALKPGDEVFGCCRGSFAEYACASVSSLAAKPPGITFEQAGCAGVASLTALQALRNKGRIQRGQTVLINGAAGGVGTFAVQIAKSLGAEVTGVCSTRNAGMVRSIGADRVVDYTRQDFTRSSERYDLIFDLAGNRSLLDCRRILKPKGIYIGAGAGPSPSVLGIVVTSITMLLLPRFVMFMAKINHDDLTSIGELMESGKVAPVIDRRYDLAEVPDAIRYAQEGHARGKVVILVA